MLKIDTVVTVNLWNIPGDTLRNKMILWNLAENVEFKMKSLQRKVLPSPLKN